MNRRTVRAVAVTVATLASVAAIGGTGSAFAAPVPDGDPAPAVAPGMLSAMERDLGVDRENARKRLGREKAATRRLADLRGQLVDTYSGGWLTGKGEKLVVGVTTPAAARKVRAAGAEPKLVARSEQQLATVKAALDARAAVAPKTVSGWYVDVANNRVVVTAQPTALDAARSFVAAAGVRADVVASAEAPRPLYDVRGGDAYYIGLGRCSIGFAVSGGFVTAGHCGRAGDATSGSNRVAQGTFQGSSFPVNDYAWVGVNSNWTPRGVVNDYAGGESPVAGSTEAPVGASVCRSGSTSGWHCGTIQAKNQTVNYSEGTVTGLTRTNACAERGDSGGSWLSGDQAQGVTSGGSGDCVSGGTTFFQPVNEILAAYGLTLVTSEGTPPPPPVGCDGFQENYTAALAATGAREYHPNGGYYYVGFAGVHKACLRGPADTDFDLQLQQWNGSAWTTVASSEGAESEESITYSGTAAYYRYVVFSYRGAGSYTLSMNRP